MQCIMIVIPWIKIKPLSPGESFPDGLSGRLPSRSEQIFCSKVELSQNKLADESYAKYLGLLCLIRVMVGKYVCQSIP